MLTAAAALAVARQHRRPEDEAVSVITSEISNAIAEASTDGLFSINYIVPAVLVRIPSYDVKQVFDSIVKKLHQAGYNVVQNGAEIIVSWCPMKGDNSDGDSDDDDGLGITVRYGPSNASKSKKTKLKSKLISKSKTKSTPKSKPKPKTTPNRVRFI